MGHIDSDHDPGQGVRAVTLRAYGIYSYRIVDPRAFFTQVSGTRDSYYAPELEGQLRNTIVARMTNSLANSNVSFLDMASTQTKMAQLTSQEVNPAFTALGLELNQFVIENISLPDGLQEVMDQRIGVNLAGDLNRYTQFEAAQALKVAAANTGGTAMMGVGLGVGAAMAQTMMRPVAAAAAAVTTAGFCPQCGKPVPERAKFCPECGRAQ
jgi:membrane protease subunit (stomatin/prohibitin family)